MFQISLRPENQIRYFLRKKLIFFLKNILPACENEIQINMNLLLHKYITG